MTQHIIRDSKGRVEKILNDQEYAEYEKRGCYSNIIFWGVLIIGIFALIYFLDKKEVKTESTTSLTKNLHLNLQLSAPIVLWRKQTSMLTN